MLSSVGIGGRACILYPSVSWFPIFSSVPSGFPCTIISNHALKCHKNKVPFRIDKICSSFQGILDQNSLSEVLIFTEVAFSGSHASDKILNKKACCREYIHYILLKNEE